MSYGALRKKLREMRMYGIFDSKDAQADQHKAALSARPSLGHRYERYAGPADNQHSNSRPAGRACTTSRCRSTEEQNTQRKVIMTIEEAHGFVSRERQDKMQQTLDQLRRIARRGRKRWLCLHFVTQSPQHLPHRSYLSWPTTR